MEFNIKISDMRIIINKILDHIEHNLGVEVVNINEDNYWDIPDKDRYDFSKLPDGFAHGQLVDDWEFILPILSNKDYAVSLNLIHVAPLLRRLGEEIGQ